MPASPPTSLVSQGPRVYPYAYQRNIASIVLKSGYTAYRLYGLVHPIPLSRRRSPKITRDDKFLVSKFAHLALAHKFITLQLPSAPPFLRVASHAQERAGAISLCVLLLQGLRSHTSTRMHAVAFGFSKKIYAFKRYRSMSWML